MRHAAVPDERRCHAHDQTAEHQQTDRASRGCQGEGGDVAAVLDGRDHDRQDPRAAAKAPRADQGREPAV